MHTFISKYQRFFKKGLFISQLALSLCFSAYTSTLTALPSQQVSRFEETRISKIDISMPAEFTKLQETSIKSRMKTKEGELFNQHDFDEDLKTLAKDYDKVEPNFSIQNGTVTIVLKIWPKPVIRSITWVGNKKIKADKLEKELEIRPSAVFDKQVFNKAFHKLKKYYIKRGYFDAELDYNVKRDAQDNVVDITITVKEGQVGHIDKIEFHNVTKKEEEDLLDAIMTKTYSFWTSWLTQEGTLNPEIFKHDELAILNYFHNEGYAEAKVTAEIKPSKKKERIILDITVDKGPLYTFGDIEVLGNKLFTTDDILKRIPIKNGDTYSPERVRQTVKAISDYYGSKGYIDAQINPETKLVKGNHQYSIHFEIDEGAKYRVGLIKVFGNTRTEVPVILHETLLVPGNIFDITLLQKTEERLRNIGYFKNVNVYAVKTDRGQQGGAYFRDVHIEVEENPTTGHFNTYVTFSTTESIAGGFGASESNFRSKGIPEVFTKGLRALRGGGEYLGFNFVVGKKQLSYTLSWTKPYFLDTPWILGVELQKARNHFVEDYSIKTYSAHINGYYPLNAFTKWGLQYRITHSFISLHHMKHDKGAKELRRESKNGGLISAVGTSLLYDSTDHPVRPSRGLKSTLSGEFAGLGGDHTFLNLTYINTAFWTPYRYGLFRFRGNLGFIKTLGGTQPKHLPLDERFFLGGDRTMRGYNFNTVGPTFHDKNHTPRGGMSQILMSVDYDQYLFKRLDGFVFFDVGNVYFKEFYLGELRYSVGGGIKIKVTESTPVTVGLGFPLNPQRKSDVKRFFFSFGTAF